MSILRFGNVYWLKVFLVMNQELGDRKPLLMNVDDLDNAAKAELPKIPTEQELANKQRAYEPEAESDPLRGLVNPDHEEAPIDEKVVQGGMKNAGRNLYDIKVS